MPAIGWTANVGYFREGLEADLRWWHVGEMQDFEIPQFTLDSADYVDLTLSYDFADMVEGLRMSLGVTNLTDEDPIIYPSSQQANTDPSTYDVLGRRYFVSATYSFQ